MYCKKRNEPDGQHLLNSLQPKRLMYMQHPEAQSGSSLDSKPTFFAAHYADATKADSKNALAVDKSCLTRSSRRITDVEELSKHSRVEYSEAAVSGVTFQKDLNLHHARKPDAESDSASVRQHMDSCHDSVFMNSKRIKLGKIRRKETDVDKLRIHCNETDGDKHGICCNESDAVKQTDVDKHRIHCNETDVDKHGIRCNESDAVKHVTFICSRVQENSGNLLSIARQGIRENAFSSISCCGQSRDDSHSNSTVISRVRHSLKTSLTHLGKNEAVSGAPRSSKNVVISSHISSEESLHAPFLDGDAINTYILSSGRLSLEEEARLGRRAPTIDDDFEEYFSSLML